MKTPIIIALIQMGSILVIVPAVSDGWHEHLRVQVLVTPGLSNVAQLVDRMGEYSRMGYWLGGVGMIALGVGSFLFNKEQAPESGKPGA